ncbi:MAG TPA: methanogenesis marker 6 protein [Candidatus Syntrophoarchaeum butanivorans]|uniref:Methanogenesis marker 6 protein n=1 Tax=Candidatus Syntropharchaeum butanivorans TaxID=1839936 RepID=A0A7C0X098_9EURY|nr:methanogenesis marker 6 protein [Candidatus Syntrophoarchaeum butanivorans]
MEEIETRVVMISPDSSITPERIRRVVTDLGLDITIKETCFGALIEGAKDQVRAAVDEIRKLDEHGIFTKVRGFPIGDPRVCRATRSGGPRPGFHQLEAEYRLLPTIRKVLDELGDDEKLISWRRKEKLPADRLREIIETFTF